MAKIIKIKSMGGSDWYKNRPGSLHTNHNMQPILKKDRKKLQAIILTLIIILSLFLFIYCRTLPPLNDHHEAEAIPETPITPSKPSVEPEQSQDRQLENLNKIIDLDYSGQHLQGVFWGEHEFQKRIYLTFDDGPNLSPFNLNGKTTTVIESILDTLDSYGFKAVFFINGKNLEYTSPAEKKKLLSVLLRIIRNGHLLGNHSYHHYNLAKGIFSDGQSDMDDISHEFMMTQSALDEILGFSYPMILIRPPYAEPGRTSDLDQWLMNEGYYLISLQYDSYDYAYSPDGRWDQQGIMTRMTELLDKEEKGGVLLLHELESSAKLLPELLERVILEKGFIIEPLEDLLQKKYSR
ncbi:polysaccharide deacetylase family protein [Oceanispirochaeta crateris]|nr:polysaccharide deacetylase family protein [Oceanispirochaeta crateris]